MKLWAGMLCSSPVLLWRPDGTVFQHETFTQAAAHVAFELGESDETNVGEMSLMLAQGFSIQTTMGDWSVVPCDESQPASL